MIGLRSYEHQKEALKITAEQSQTGNYKHGLRNTRLYRIWAGMKNRCYNQNDSHYSRWGAKGIVVCDEWKNDFQAFYDWAICHGYSDELTRDRIDNDGNYSPDNCRWATVKEQNCNKKNVKFIEFNGESKLLDEWAEVLNIKPKTLWMRLYFYNWPVKKHLLRK